MESDSSSQEEIFGDSSEGEVQELSEEEVEDHPIVAEVLYTTPLHGKSPSPVSSNSDNCMLAVHTHHLGAIPKNYMTDLAFQRKDKIARSPGGKRAEEPSTGEVREGEGAEKVGEEAEGEIGQGAEGEIGKGGAKGRKEGNEKVLVEDIESEGD